MASKYKGYWKCEYNSIGRTWGEYYFVRTSAEWYYYDHHMLRWEPAWINSLIPRKSYSFRRHMGYNMDPRINVDGNRTFRKITPLEIILVCGQLCKSKRRKKNGCQRRT